MRTAFHEYYRPSESDFEDLWLDAIIAFDASVLLNLYNYSSATAETFLTVLKALKQPLWLPNQAGLEYHRNRIGSIVKAAKEYEVAKSPIPDLLTKVKSRRQGPFLSADLTSRIEQLATDLGNELDTEHKRIKAMKSVDPIRDQLTELFDGKVGVVFPQATLDKIYAEGKERYTTKTPPGYMDEKEKQGNDIYGDLVIWKELIEKSKADKKPLIFVTDDSKEDWWWLQDGGTIGPRVELLREFRTETSQSVYLYSSDTFLQYADKHLTKSIDKDALEEIREIRERDRLLTFEKGYEELDEPVDSEIERLKARLDDLIEEEDFESEEYQRTMLEYDRLLAKRSASHFTSLFLPTLSEGVRAKRASLIESIQSLLAECRKSPAWDDRSEYKLPQWLEHVPEEMIPYTSLPNLMIINENLREYLSRHIKMH